MKLQVNKSYSGFNVLRAEHIEEIDSTAYILEHAKSGAKLLFLENKDDNKVFSISFRTPPTDHTGIAHILEHSVLCGSEKFPLKEPFVELVKGSMNTFLNAMTFPDKTMYPIASRNNQDFRNLMNVYLDAVFFPNIYQNKNTLKQEGWSYYMESADAQLTYKGVVYNEMKGVFSSPDSVLEFETMKALFPETAYGMESGGHPDHITELTQEQFEKFHSDYYHPTNSYIYLYGDLDIASTLTFIDQDYLSRFNKKVINSAITLQAPFPKTVLVNGKYPLATGDSASEKTLFNMSFVVGQVAELEKSLALTILESVLLNMPGAPLKQALIDANIAQDISGNFLTSIRQPIFTITALGTEKEKFDSFINVVYKTLQDLVNQGLDKELLESALNRIEFQTREADFGSYPKGLIYAMKVLGLWLYDEDPCLSLRYEKLFADLRAKISTNYFESIIENVLLDNTHRAIVCLEPEAGLEDVRQKKEDAYLAELKTSWSPTQIEKVVADTKKLQELQAAVDSEEILHKIPLLDRNDIKKKVETYDTTVVKMENAEVLRLNIFTNGIVYLSFLFDGSMVAEEDIPYLFLMEELFYSMSTDKYSYLELAKLSGLHTGGINASVACRTRDDNTVLDPFFRVSVKMLLNKVPQTLDLLENAMFQTIYGDKKRLKEILAEAKVGWEADMFAQGQTIALTRLGSYFSKDFAFEEKGHLSLYYFLVDLCDNFDSKIDDLIKKLEQLAKQLFNNKSLFISIAANDDTWQKVQPLLTDFVKKLPCVEYNRHKYEFKTPTINEGIITPGKVQFVATGGNFKKYGYEYHGAMAVLETVLRYEYLWTKIRVQGGAYGATIMCDRTGNLLLSSYRDPNLEKTVQVYKDMPAYLKSFAVSTREMTKYVIGTMSKLDTPQTNSMLLSRVTTFHLKDISDEQRQITRDEILKTTPEDIRWLGEVFEKTLSDDYICVVGSEQKIKQNTNLFNKIFSALKQ